MLKREDLRIAKTLKQFVGEKSGSLCLGLSKVKNVFGCIDD